MRWMTVLLLLICSAGAVAAEVWRWVDENGETHFSDRPHPGAEQVDLAPAQTFTAPALPPPRQPAPRAAAEPASPYSRVTIVSPEAGEMFWNIGGQLTVQLALEPQLIRGHELRMFLDGNRVQGVPQGPVQFTIGEVFRGEHTLRAAIFDSGGRELASSEAITFYVQQTSIQNPARNRPRPTGGG
ncbi:MAG: DUF4124 domain-containing protein [Gammaproteobacteria bacterium]